MVPAGEAGVITRFGNPTRVVTEPGLAWKLPAPFESTIPIDLRLRTTSTGLQDVGTRDGLRVLVQAYVAWRVPGDPPRVRQFLRSVRNQPDEAARQLRSYVNAALHTVSSNFDLTDLVNIDPKKVQLDAFEQQLREQIAPRMLEVYGIDIRQVGIERMTLPDETLAATVARMRAIARRWRPSARRKACGRPPPFARTRTGMRARSSRRRASRRRTPRPMRSRRRRASTARRIRRIPGLYTTLRSLDTINQVIGRNTSLILRTDAAPFRVLVEGRPAPRGGSRHGRDAVRSAARRLRARERPRKGRRRRRRPGRSPSRSRSGFAPSTSRRRCWGCCGSRAMCARSPPTARRWCCGSAGSCAPRRPVCCWPGRVRSSRCSCCRDRSGSSVRSVTTLAAQTEKSAALVGPFVGSRTIPRTPLPT